MPRYFFNIFNRETTFDTHGTELSDVKQVRLHMVALALSIFENNKDSEDVWEMEVIDDRGEIVSTMDFGVEVER